MKSASLSQQISQIKTTCLKHHPITCVLTVDERHEAVVFETLMEQGAIKRPGLGRPRLRRVEGHYKFANLS
jgi:hypothetical protein